MMGGDRNPTPIYEINEYMEWVRKSMPFRLSYEEAEDRINGLIFTLMDLKSWYEGCRLITEEFTSELGNFAWAKQEWNTGSAGVNKSPTFMRQSPRFGTDTLYREFGEGKGVNRTILETVSAKDKFVEELHYTMDWIEFMFRNVEGLRRHTTTKIDSVMDMVRTQFPDMDLVQGYHRQDGEDKKRVVRVKDVDEDEQI